MATARTRKPQTRKASTQRGTTAPETQSSTTSTPTVEELSFKQCDNCSVGVLQVVRYDPDSLHEVGQDLSADNQHPSGGGYETQCLFCGQRLSHTLAGDVAEGGAN